MAFYIQVGIMLGAIGYTAYQAYMAWSERPR